MLITLRCAGCHRSVHYWPEDLIKVLGAHWPADRVPWPCSKCRTAEYLRMSWSIPSASEVAVGITVRRPVEKYTAWRWKTVKG